MNTDDLRDEWEDEVVDWLRGMDDMVSWDQLDTLLTPLATAVLPIVEAEVRKAKAEALREAASDIVWSAETLPHMTPHDAARGLVRRANRIEKEPTR